MNKPASTITDLPESTTIGIFGAGGHGREIACIVDDCGIARSRYRFVVDSGFTDAAAIDGVPVMVYGEFAAAFPGAPMIVAIGDGGSRKTVVARLAAHGHAFPTVLSPRAVFSPRTSIGAGVIVFPNCTISVDLSIGVHVHVNANCSISHDVRIGPYSTLSPGVTVCGHVEIGSGVFLGANACIVNGTDAQPVAIGDGARVAAGAAVTGPVEAGSLVAGVPAVRKR